MNEKQVCWILALCVVAVALAGCLGSTQDETELDPSSPDGSDGHEENGTGNGNGGNATNENEDDRSVGGDNGDAGDEEVPAEIMLTLSVSVEEVPVLPGVTESIGLQVKNIAEASGGFSLVALVPAGWEADMDPAQASLDAGAGLNATIDLKAPSNAEVGDSQEIEIQALDPGGAVLAQASLLAVVDHPYEQDVWFNWQSMQLDVLILGVEDPLVGNAIKEGIEAWKVGIRQLAPGLWEDPSLVDELEFRVYWAGVDGAPPGGFIPDILFVPQGFMALIGPFGPVSCIAMAPMVAGWGAMYHVAAHEFGHCLGLEHVYEHGEEYEPAFDIMGGGESGFHSCPSNLNLIVMEQAFTGGSGTYRVASGAYNQAKC